MDSRERVLKTLGHEESDRIRFDLGPTVASGIHATAYRTLRQALGLPVVEPRIEDMIQQTAAICDDVAGRLPTAVTEKGQAQT